MNESANKTILGNTTKKEKSALENRFDEIMQESAEENLQNLEEMFARYKNETVIFFLWILPLATCKYMYFRRSLPLNTNSMR
jgi:alpha-L-fucosidase